MAFEKFHHRYISFCKEIKNKKSSLPFEVIPLNSIHIQLGKQRVEKYAYAPNQYKTDRCKRGQRRFFYNMYYIQESIDDQMEGYREDQPWGCLSCIQSDIACDTNILRALWFTELVSLWVRTQSGPWDLTPQSFDRRFQRHKMEISMGTLFTIHFLQSLTRLSSLKPHKTN